MPLDANLVGRSFPPTPPFAVSPDKIGEFCAAVGQRYSGGPAPVTFAIVVAFRAMADLMADPSAGIELHHVVHGEQRFVYTRPVVPGDTLTATLTVESLRQVAGADIIGTRSDIATVDGEHVVAAYATLVHRAPA